MLRILGSEKRLCDGLSRRDLLQAGSISLLGLGLGDLAQATTAQHAAGGNFGRAKNVILLFLYGGMSQLDTFDPKPEAPDDIRGPFQPIATAVPGLHICEHLPRVARVMDRVTLVRSMSHPHPIHGVAYALTGTGQIDIPMELNRDDRRHWPYFGSVLDYLDEQDHPELPLPPVPRTVHLPWVLSSRSQPHQRAGLFGGFLGRRYDPVVAEFTGTASRSDTYRPDDPFGGVNDDCRFEIAHTSLPEGITLDRLDTRRRLLEQFEAQRRDLDGSAIGRSVNRNREMAYSVLTSPELRNALDLSQEPADVRDRYGRHLFGQSTLLARRLIESGSRLVSVFWDEFGRSCGAWDTHEKLTMRIKDELCPGFDQTFPALLDDLEQRGLLDETLVLVLTEHGRTPQPQRRDGSADGRGHWSQCYSCLFAGAGIAQGRVIGASDEQAAWPADRPVSPKDILHTVYHLLGIDTERILHDQLGRPLPLVAEGQLVPELLA